MARVEILYICAREAQPVPAFVEIIDPSVVNEPQKLVGTHLGLLGGIPAIESLHVCAFCLKRIGDGRSTVTVPLNRARNA